MNYFGSPYLYLGQWASSSSKINRTKVPLNSYSAKVYLSRQLGIQIKLAKLRNLNKERENS